MVGARAEAVGGSDGPLTPSVRLMPRDLTLRVRVVASMVSDESGYLNPRLERVALLRVGGTSRSSMTEEPRVEAGDVGITIREGASVLGSFPWGEGDWTLRLTDTRVKGQFQPPLQRTGKIVVGVPDESPRITSVDGKGRDQDRDLLGLVPDAAADPVLLTNNRLEGTVKLHFGPLHARSIVVTDGVATQLILEAVRRGYEVRRSIGHVDGVGPSELVTLITTRRASETLETEPSRWP